MSTRRYPFYKDTGLAWIGHVPSDWDVRRLGFYFAERRQKVSDTEFQPLSVTKHGIVPRLETAAKSDDGDNRKLVRQGDFVINGRSDRKGSSGLSELDGSVSLINIVLRKASCANTHFMQYLLKSVSFQEEFYRFGRGIVDDLWSTSFSEMRNIKLAVPSAAEQQAIADFLDRETAKIDALVSEQERLLALLMEKRQAVISRAVTQGMDPSVSMKDSGVEWLGRVPAHWSSTRLGRYVTMLSGNAFPSADFVSGGEGVRLLRGINVGVGRIRWDECVCWPHDKVRDFVEFSLREGDIVLGMDRPWIAEGVRLARVRSSDLPCLLLQRVAALRVSAGLCSDYLMLLLGGQGFVNHIMPDMTGVSVPHLSPGQVSNFQIPLPPVDEQFSIAQFANEQKTALETLITQSKATATLLHERRSALISAAVTGKMDVRGLMSSREPEVAEAAREAA